MLRLAPVLLGFTLLAGCNGGSGNDSNAQENDSAKGNQEQEMEKGEHSSASAHNKKSKPLSQDKDFKTVSNDRFGFKIAIPKEWEAINRSDNQDGIFIKTGNDKTDLRVYGEQLSKTSMDLNAPDCKEKKAFSFADGQEGFKCLSNNDVLMYYQETEEKRITFYIKAPAEWRSTQADRLKRIAKSLTFKKGKQVS